MILCVVSSPPWRNFFSMKLKWEELDPGTYETMTSVLLSRLHPGMRRIDGSGGYGGRDLHFPGPNGLEIDELKSFTGRLTKGGKGQIKRSLRGAAEPAADGPEASCKA